MSHSESSSELVLELAEEFLDRYRKGERPPLKEYIERHPELAAEIREVFPAMAMMENIAVADESLEGADSVTDAKPKEVAVKQLGDYRIIREIGHGGMGVVYEAEQVSLGRHVALKVLPNQALQDAKQKRRFEREARAAAKLHHTNIVPVFGVGEDDGLPYYVMQFIQGLGLDTVLDELNRMQPGAAHTPTGLPTAGEIRISRRDVSATAMARSLITGTFQQATDDDERAAPQPVHAATIDEPADDRPGRPAVGSSFDSAKSSATRLAESFTVSSSSITLPGGSGMKSKTAARKQSYWQSVAHIGRQVADALEYAHKQGVLHRDIKPSNLLLDLRGTVWVTDFGLAKVAGPGAENLTHTGDILGTLRYMPPEAFEGKSDARSDVYSLGLTLYELLALRPAFDERERNKLIKQVTTGTPAALDRVRHETPRDLVTIIQKAIDREPTRRYATAEDFASDLQRFLDDEPILARRQTQLERYWRWARHNPAIAVLGGLLTLVLFVVTFASLLVASHMSALADNEAQAADDERLARQEADDAKERESKERAQAESAKQAAEQSKQRAEQALQKAEENFAKARAAVNDYLTAVSEDERLKAPGLQGLRIQLLQSALQFYQQFLKERGTDPTLRRELAGIYLKVGEVYRDLGRLPQAKTAFAQSLRLYETLAKESPDDPELQHGLALALYRSGARAKAIPILEKLIDPEDPRYHADLGSVYNDMGLNDTKSDKATELDFLRKALTVRERLVRLNPDDPDARLGLSASLNNIAIRLKEERSAEALALLQNAVEQGEAAYRLRPADLLTARFLTIQLNNVANKAKKEGQTEIALAAHRRRIEVLDRRARDNPTIPGFDADLADGYARLLNELRDAGRLEEAAKTADKASARLAETTEETADFFRKVMSFRLATHALALGRAKADPDGEVNTETEAAAAVHAMRQYALSGWSDPKLLLADSQTEPLRQRSDFKELLVRLDELGQAHATAKLTTATNEEKRVARQKIVLALETLAGPPPHPRFVRRHLAQARQDWAQALLEAGQVDEARLAFDDALLVRQQLVQESPSNEQLRADLAQSQSAAGDLFAAAGKLADAVKVWDKALATLEEGLKTNPNSIPYRTALAEQLGHVAIQESKFGLWDAAVKHYGRATAIQSPTQPSTWNFVALVAAKTQDLPLLRAVAVLAARNSENTGDPGTFRHRALVTSPITAAAHATAVRNLAEEYQSPWHNQRWARGLAYLRAGQTEKASQTVEGLTPAEKPWPEWQILALIQHSLGRRAEATEALRQADLLADKRIRAAVAGDQLKLPLIWDEWLHNELLRAEAHQSIHDQPMPASPYERLFRGRVFFALEQPDKAEAEFAAAVAVRPDDADVWLTRSRVFAKLGRKDRMAADLLRAQELKGDDPRTWIETGRMLAEQGEHQQADIAFARASVLGKGELNRFLDAGWWVVGPYPEQIDRVCPPQRDPDPSKPVAALGQNREWKWQTTPTTAHSGAVGPGPVQGGSEKASVYYLAYVCADRDRTADLHFRTASDARMWVNGRLAFDGFAAWGIGKEESVRVPVALSAGRNTLLVKVSGTKDRRWFECLFHDAPALRAIDLAHLGVWPETADAFAEADRRTALDPWRSHMHMLCLLVAGRDDEYRRAFAEMVRRYDRPGSEDIPGELAMACYLPPEKSLDRDRWVKRWEKQVAANPMVMHEHLFLGNAYFRAGRFLEAERSFRKAAKLQDHVLVAVQLASTCHHLGRVEEARKLLRAVERRYDENAREALKATMHRLPDWYEAQARFLITLREARTLIDGKDPGPDKSEPALLARAREWRAELEKAEDHFARLLMTSSDQPRLWIDRGRRLGELKRWDEAAKAFDKASELTPNDVLVWRTRGRAYADLGKWDEAAADFVKALELAPPAKSDWLAGSFPLHDQVVRLEEVFCRVAKLRPTDQQLWIQRVHYLGRTAQWPKAAKAIARVAELDPDDHLTWHFQATLLAKAGDLEGYRKVCRDMMTRFGNTDSATVAQRVATACLIAPGAEDPSPLLLMMSRLKAAPVDQVWHDATMGLGHYREGQWDQALKVLAPHSKASEYSYVVALAIRGMAQFKQEQAEAARQTLQQAREGMARFAKPGRGELQDNWFNWHQSEMILREAETLIPAAAVAVGASAATAQDYAAQRDRKARADSLSTQAALAQIRLDIGQKTEAETELRALLAERQKVAAEEPANLDYQADLATAHEQLGQFLVGDGRIEDGVKETQLAVTLLEQFAGGNPKAARLQVNLAANLFSIADFHWKAGRLAEGRQAWQRALENLKASRDAATKDSKVAKIAGDLELVAGRAYVNLGLWTEASGHFRRAFEADPVAGKVTDRFHHAALLVLTGAEDEYRRYCASVYERGGSNLRDWYSAKMMVLRPGALPDPKDVVALVQETRDATKDEWWTVLDLALAQLRADQVDDAMTTLQKFENTSKRGWQFSWPALALARHRAGKTDEAREWLQKTEDWSAAAWAKHLALDSTGLPKDGGAAFWVYFLSLRQEAIATVGGMPAPADPWLHLHRGRAYGKLGLSEKAEAEFQAAAQAQPDDPRILLSRSRIHAALGKTAQAKADRGRAQHLAEQALAKRPDDGAAADTLAGLLMEKAESKWEVLKPLAVKSDGGATLTVQPDVSVLASGKNQDHEVYTIEAEVHGRIGGIRLEAIPDPSLVQGGSGRNSFGNFILTDFRVTVGQDPVQWKRAIADFSQAPLADEPLGFPIAHAIDADESTGWAVGPRVAEPHWAVFLPMRSFGGDKTRLTVRMAFQNKNRVKHGLGRFRLSVTSEAEMVPYSEWFLAAATPHAKLGAAYLAVGDAKGAADFLTKATAANPTAPAADWLILSLAHAKLKDTDQVNNACAKAAELLKPTGADESLRPLLREVALVLGTNQPVVQDLIAAAAGDPPAALNEDIAQHPDKAEAYRNRGDWLAARGRWKEARADFAAEYRLAPSPYNGMRFAILLIQTGEVDRYREHCQDMLQRWGSTDGSGAADLTLKTVLFLRNHQADAKQLAHLAEVLSRDKQADWYDYYLFARGLHAYRSGRYDDALAACRESRSRAPTTKGNAELQSALNFTVEALALHGKGDADESRRVLDQARTVLRQNVPGIDGAAWWHDWLAAHILFREAEELIASQKSVKKGTEILSRKVT